MKKVVVLTGAGISAESGIKTFRDSGGLWEEVDINEVATPEGWKKNPARVLEFYNLRRKQVLDAKPNAGHLALAELENVFDVQVITQNIDNLHERAGSKKVLHLHGEVTKSRSSLDPGLIYEIEGWQLDIGDKCSKGSQLRPHIVWFGELVPNMELAYRMASEADIFIVVGTSLNVHPAAGLVHYAPEQALKFFVDPNPAGVEGIQHLELIQEKAGKGLPTLVRKLLSESH